MEMQHGLLNYASNWVLQCGHDFSTMEIYVLQKLILYFAIPLQYGHDFSAMEMLLKPGKSTSGRCCFNVAMTFQSWIGVQAAPPLRWFVRASMWP